MYAHSSLLEGHSLTERCQGYGGTPTKFPPAMVRRPSACSSVPMIIVAFFVVVISLLGVALSGPRHRQGLLSILKKIKEKEKETRLLILCVPLRCARCHRRCAVDCCACHTSATVVKGCGGRWRCVWLGPRGVLQWAGQRREDHHPEEVQRRRHLRHLAHVGLQH